MMLTEEQEKILAGKVCWYCHVPTQLKNSCYGFYYVCPKCGAYVGCHKGTTRSKGMVADYLLRKYRIEAHRAFNKKKEKEGWSTKVMYTWLSIQLSLPSRYTHIGMFSVRMCKKVMEVCNAK